MDDVLREQIYQNLNLRETENLLEIWQTENMDEWDAVVFEIIQGILLERLGCVPPQSIQAQIKQVFNRVDSFRQAGELDKALIECEFAIQMAPDRAIAFNYRGLIYDELGQLGKAIADYQEAIRLDPDMENAWDNLISVEREIEEQFQQSSTKQHLDQALAYAYNEEPEKAFQECELARQTMPGIAIAYNYLGMILEELGQLETAIETYLKAIRLNPRFYAARENLGNARLKFEEELARQAALEDWDAAQEESWCVEEAEISQSVAEPQDPEKPEKDNPIPVRLYLDEKAFMLVGWPGFRTRPGRSGYDPLDTDFEAAHMAGVIIRLLLIRKFRTHNPLCLIMMTCIGFVTCLPLLFLGTTIFRSFWGSILILFISSPYWIVGAALLINVYLSLSTKQLDENEQSGNIFY